MKANSVLGKARTVIGRAAPLLHKVRAVTDTVGAVAGSPLGGMIPGAGVVRGVARAVALADDAARKIGGV